MTNYPLRLPEHVMADAKALAEASGASLNQFLSAVIAERVGELKALQRIRQRIANGDPARALAVLDRAPDVAPVAGDELID